jgi:hypothetical protein
MEKEQGRSQRTLPVTVRAIIIESPKHLFERQLVFEGAVDVTDVHVGLSTGTSRHRRVGFFERRDVGQEDSRVPPAAEGVDGRVNVERSACEEQRVSDSDREVGVCFAGCGIEDAVHECGSKGVYVSAARSRV